MTILLWKMSTVQRTIPFVILIAVAILIGMFYVFYLEGRQQNENAVKAAVDANQSAADAKDIAVFTAKQSVENGIYINKTLERLIKGQERGNIRGNTTLNAIDAVLKIQLANERNLIGNLTAHRIIANNTRDEDRTQLNVLGNITSENNALLKQLLNITS